MNPLCSSFSMHVQDLWRRTLRRPNPEILDRVIEAANDSFAKSTQWDDGQKEILKKAAGRLAKQAETNLGKNYLSRAVPEEKLNKYVAALVEEMQQMVVSVGPRAPGSTAPDGTPWIGKTRELTGAKKALFELLLGETQPLLKNLMATESSVLKAVFLQKDIALLKEGKELIQDLLKEVGSKIIPERDIEKAEKKPREDVGLENLDTPQGQRMSADDQAELLIGNFLSYYAFLGPITGNSLDVPVKIDGEWQSCKYTVETMDLTPKWLGSPIRAFLLKPDNENQKAPPLLIYKGTTYPTDDGFLMSLMTDINPAAGVGSYAFATGRKKIKKRLEEVCTNNRKVRTYGASLGGKLAVLTGIHCPDKVEKVYAYGTPGLSRSEKRKWKKASETNNTMPEMHMYEQENDKVSFLDKRPKMGNHHYKIFGNEEPSSSVWAHATMMGAQSNAIVVKLKPEQEKSRLRSFLTVLHTFLSIPFFVGLTVIWIIGRVVALLKIACVAALHLCKKRENEGQRDNGGVAEV